MKKTQMRRWVWVGVAGFCLAVFLGTMMMQETAEAQSGHRLLGGPRGAVRSAVGEPLEGIMVQLISQKTAIRTTVYSNKAGQYEFPKLADGSYRLRIARPICARCTSRGAQRPTDGRARSRASATGTK